MSVWAIALVRDEIDIIAETVGWMLQQVDEVMVADNNSVDGTREWLIDHATSSEFDHRLHVQEDPEPGHFQSRKVSALAEQARHRGAEWVIPFDGDEIWGCSGHIARRLGSLGSEVLVCEAAILNHVPTSLDPEGPPVARMRWREASQLPMRKVACRTRRGLVIGEGNHDASYPGIVHPPTVTNLLSIRHYPYRSPEQMIRKARNGAEALAATDLPEEIGKHWRDYGRLSDEQLREVFHEHFFSADPDADGLVYDPAG